MRFFDQFFFSRLQYRAFVSAHPPSNMVEPAPKKLLTAYRGKLPEGLIELWKKAGLGQYGACQIALINPETWQPALDRWITSPADGKLRIPIALTPFGQLIYYRRLSDTDEDVAILDPFEKTTDVVCWSLDEFFCSILTSSNDLDELISPALLEAAREQCGYLDPGQIYELDQMHFSMELLHASRSDALELHARLRDAVDPPRGEIRSPKTNTDAIPPHFRKLFAGTEGELDELTGTYLATYIDWYRALKLAPDGSYHLLFWCLDSVTGDYTDIRYYTGRFDVSLNEERDQVISLAIELNHDSLGSDANDGSLVVYRSATDLLLLREEDLEHIATMIGARDVLGSGESYFRKIDPSAVFEDEPIDGRTVRSDADLPGSLQKLLHTEPLYPTITKVSDINPDEEEDGTGTIICVVDLGQENGLRMNMPLYSIEQSAKSLRGWVWGLESAACRVGIGYERDETGAIVDLPEIGDRLTTRAPTRELENTLT